MMKPKMAGLLLAVFLGTLAAPALGNKAQDVDGQSIGEQATDDGDPYVKKEYKLLTGLDFSYWAGVNDPIFGPGVSFGFVLLPRHLEFKVTLGAMTGHLMHAIPLEINFNVPFFVNDWFSPYINFGPTFIPDRFFDRTEYDWAISMGAGIELLPRGFDWGVYAEFDYNLRFQQDTRHQYGFTAGFNYRF